MIVGLAQEPRSSDEVPVGLVVLAKVADELATEADVEEAETFDAAEDVVMPAAARADAI